MLPKHLIKLIERYEKLLPSIVYSNETSLAWDSEYQRNQVAKMLSIQALEERIRELELVRGDGVYVYSTDGYHKPIDEKIRELHDSINQIKSI